MLRHSFIFLERVTCAMEQNLRRQGISDWNSFISAGRIIGISEKTKKLHEIMLLNARKALIDDDSLFFAERLPPTEHWRCYNDFKDGAVFLDIETGTAGEVTVVGMHSGDETRTLVRGINLDKKALEKELSRHRILVTFNGKSFDMPCLRKYFGTDLKIPHIDIMHVCRRVGLTGGLKEIEKKLGIKRPETLKYVKGEDAAELWRCWQATGDRDFLDMLVAYNEEDCANLKMISDIAVSELWEKTRLCTESAHSQG